MNDSISKLIQDAVNFRDARDWKQFHNPKDLAISISLEAAELLEIFQWSGSNIEVDSDNKLEKVKEELADIFVYSLLMANDLDLDIEEIVRIKLAENNRKYPVEKAFGKSNKYTDYLSEATPEESL